MAYWYFVEHYIVFNNKLQRNVLTIDKYLLERQYKEIKSRCGNVCIPAAVEIMLEYTEDFQTPLDVLLNYKQWSFLLNKELMSITIQ